MYKRFILALAVLSLVAAAPLLIACHTTAGAGTGHLRHRQGHRKSAKKNTP